MRTIHFGFRFAIVLLLTLAFYLGVTFLFRQTLQVPALITLLIAVVGAERLSVFLEWIGPVIGTMNKQKQEQEQTQIVEYLLDCSLRYASPLAIAAIRSKKRLSLHVVSRHFRKSDVVLRNAPDYLLALLPFTTLEQASLAVERLNSRLPIKQVVLADVSMLQALVEAQRTLNHSEADIATTQELRSICFQAFDAKLASIKSGEKQTNKANKTDGPAISYLNEPGSSDLLSGWLGTLQPDKAEASPLPGPKNESATITSL